jgi:hypothetical protein
VTRTLCALAATVIAAAAHAADFGVPGAPLPPNLVEVSQTLRQAPYDMELLISYGTSKGGSAGHLALALRDEIPGDDLVYSANFYADRDPAHEGKHYTADLMVRVPKLEYLYGTSSSLGPTAEFGLDYGEVYKRSVIGVRVYGVPAQERQALAAFFARLNDDYRARAKETEYHDDEIRYNYLRLNCAKTIGSAFRYGAGYADLEVTSAGILSGRRVVAAANANIPAEMAMKLVREWHARGYGLDVVLYRKYPASPYVDPGAVGQVPFKDLPNRFPSVLSRDFRSGEGEYHDYDNLYAGYLLFNLARYRVSMDAATGRLAIDRTRDPLPYAEAARRAAEGAKADSTAFRLTARIKRKGTSIEAEDNPRLFADGDAAAPSPAPSPPLRP